MPTLKPPYVHDYTHPGPQDCIDYNQCHARAYGLNEVTSRGLGDMFFVRVENAEGTLLFRQTYLTQADAHRARYAYRLRPGEVITVGPEIPVVKPLPRPFVLVDITGGVVQGEWFYEGTGKPIVHVIDTDYSDSDADAKQHAAERFMDIAAEWQTYVDALTDSAEQAQDQADLLDLREEADAMLDDAQGQTLIAGQLYDNETGQEANA